jgi:hypothetical protein
MNITRTLNDKLLLQDTNQTANKFPLDLIESYKLSPESHLYKSTYLCGIAGSLR